MIFKLLKDFSILQKLFSDLIFELWFCKHAVRKFLAVKILLEIQKLKVNCKNIFQAPALLKIIKNGENLTYFEIQTLIDVKYNIWPLPVRTLK